MVWDPLALPEPELPLPNNAATRFDPTSPTGRRLNLSTQSPLSVERKVRRQLDRLDGFSVTGAIQIPFDAPLDLATVGPEAVQLFDISPDSPDYGKQLPLDFGSGAIPVHFKPRAIFPFELNAELPDLLFGPGNDFQGERVFHYEVETNTLLVRPMFPLRPRTTYAVVLTPDLHGLDGEPVRSPFDFVNHTDQTKALAPLRELVDGGVDGIAFAWSFTTRSIVEDPSAIRDGLDGIGPLAWLKERYPGRFVSFTDMGIPHDGDGSVEGLPNDPRDHRYTLKPGVLPKILGSLGPVAAGLDKLSFDHVDYVVLGTIEAPDYRDPEDQAIWVNGSFVHHRPAQVPFALTVPKATPEHQPPFPVIIYNHGARTSRFELVLVAEHMARAGIAMIGVDASGHGPFGGDIRALLAREAADFPPELLAVVLGAAAKNFLGADYEAAGKDLEAVLTDLEGNGLFRAIFVDGRTEDLDGDGVLLSGDGYFVPNPFELASNGLQTVFDSLLLLRLLERLDPAALPAALDDPRAAPDEEVVARMKLGDFNADGVLDIGGPDNTYFAMGTSLGGIHTSVLLGLEPRILTGVPIVSGGGMTDILVRTDLSDAVDAILAEPIGPGIIGCPLPADFDDPGAGTEVSLSWNNWSLKCRNQTTIRLAEESSELGRVPVVKGGIAELHNDRIAAEGGERFAPDAVRTSPIGPDGSFSVTVGADEGDVLRLVLRDADGAVAWEGEKVARRAGLGRLRNTPRLRRLIQFAQIAMDVSDPNAWARYLIREPLGGGPPKNVLHLADIGDKTVPFASMVSWDRAVGLLGLDDDDALAVTAAFVAHAALDGIKPHWDIDDLGEAGDGIGPLPLIKTASGVSAVRYPATSDHEYIALPDPKADFDWAMYSRNQVLWFLSTGGAEIRDDLCMETDTCEWLPR